MMRRVLIFVVAMLAASACGGSGDGGVDRRPDVLAELGGPDAFVITVDEVDDSVVRLETWRYYEAATQLEFVDGELLWSVEIESLPDGSLYPLWYDPAEFTMLASMGETLSVLDDVTLTEIDPGDEAMPDTVLLAGDQLLLAFTHDKLIYVETFPLSPEEVGP